MAIPSDVQQALDRLAQYNSSAYDSISNPRGLAWPGYVTEFPRALKDFSTVANFTGGMAADIGVVSANITAVNTVAGRDADIATVAARDADIHVVAGRDADIGKVAAVDAEVGIVAGKITDVEAVAAVADDVAALAPVAGDVTAVAGIKADVEAVAAIDDDVSAVAAKAADVSTVAGVAADVSAVAGIAADVTAVAGIDDDVSALAPIAADVTTAAANIADIKAAPGAAVAASDSADLSAAWAEGHEPGGAGTKSAKEWAEEAEADAVTAAATTLREFGIRIYNASGVPAGTYDADLHVAHHTVQSTFYAEIVGGAAGGEVDLNVEVNGATVYGPVTVAYGTPVANAVSIDVPANAQVKFMVIEIRGTVTELAVKTMGAIAP